MIGIVLFIKLALRVWLAVNASKPFQRLHEIDANILRLSTDGTESALLQIENLAKERLVISKLIGTLHTDLNDKS